MLHYFMDMPRVIGRLRAFRPLGDLNLSVVIKCGTIGL